MTQITFESYPEGYLPAEKDAYLHVTEYSLHKNFLGYMTVAFYVYRKIRNHYLWACDRTSSYSIQLKVC